jgi:hypothetical protein
MPVRRCPHSFAKYDRKVKRTDACLLRENAKVQAVGKVSVDVFEYPLNTRIRDALAGQRLAPFKTPGWTKQKVRSKPLRSSLSVKIWSSASECVYH